MLRPGVGQMVAEVDEGSGKLRRYVSIYGTALALAVVLITGLLLIDGNGTLGDPDTKFQIGLNLIAAAVYGSILAGIAAWVLERNQIQAIREAVRTEAADVHRLVAAASPTYIPAAVYPASDGFSEDFNRDLMDSISRSGSYAFCGPSPRHVAVRLRCLPKPPRSVRIAMVDPTFQPSVHRRAVERGLQRVNAKKDADELKGALYQELLFTIVDLFDYREFCSVELVYHYDPIVYRFEMTDDAVFLSWYNGPSSPRRPMPESMQFQRSSFYYSVLSQTMARRFEASDSVKFTGSSGDEDLVDHLARLLDDEDEAREVVAQARLTRRQRGKKLTDYLRTIGYG